MQPPSSQWGVSALPGPVKQLRETCTVFGLSFVALAWLMPWVSPDRTPKMLLGVLLSSVALILIAATYGATTGMHGVQIQDPRPDSQVLFWVKSIGQLIVFGCLLEIGRRLLSSSPLHERQRYGAMGETRH